MVILAAVGCGSSGAGGAADLSAPDAAVSDLGRIDPDLSGSATPDLAVRDAPGSDLSTMDLSTVDLARPDLVMPDLARPDLAVPPDLFAPDLAMPDLYLPGAVVLVAPRWTSYAAGAQRYYAARGIDARVVSAVPADLTPFRVLFVLDPSDWLSDADLTRVATWVGEGRRLVIVGDHCRGGINGCFVDKDRINALAAALGLHLTYDGYPGAYNDTGEIQPHRLTAGVASMYFRWTGAITNPRPPAEVPVRSTGGTHVLIAVERATGATRYGDVVVIADMDTLQRADTDPGSGRFMGNLYDIP